MRLKVQRRKIHKTQKKRLRQLSLLRSSVWALGGVVAALFATKYGYAAPILQEQTTALPTDSVWPVLMPLATASVGIERAVEVVWNYIEWLLLSSRRWQPADLKTAQYLQFKSGSSLLLGAIVGILVANFLNMRLFGFLTPYAPNFFSEGVAPSWDVLVTGFIIGAGAKPAHEILGGVTQVKNFLNNASINQRELAGANFAQGVQRLADSERQSMVDVPGVGPSRLPSGAPLPMGMAAPDGEEGAESEEARLQRYADILHNATAR